MTSTRIISVVAALVIACASAAPASAWGERKNQVPFVRTVVTHPFVSGEPKNEPPFTNSAAGLGLALVAAGVAAFAMTSRRHAALQ